MKFCSLLVTFSLLKYLNLLEPVSFIKKKIDCATYMHWCLILYQVCNECIKQWTYTYIHVYEYMAIHRDTAVVKPPKKEQTDEHDFDHNLFWDRG